MTTTSETKRKRQFGAGFARELVAIALVVAVMELVHGQGARWFAWHASAEANPGLAEGRRWWEGRLDLPERLWDTALVPETGRVYNVYPPLLTIVGFLAAAPLPGRAVPADVPEFLPLVVFGLPPVIAGYWAFGRLVRGPWWPAIMTLGWFGGTAMIAVTRLARDGDVHHLNHVLSQVGLLVLAAEALTRRRAWVMLAGLGIAVWTRQLTIFFAPAVLLATLAAGRGQSQAVFESSDASDQPPSWRVATGARRGGLIAIVVGVVALLVVPMGLAWVKFGSPLRSGYDRVYEGRNDAIAARVHTDGVFSTAYVRRNAYYMNVALPVLRCAGSGVRVEASAEGTSLWFTSPILVLAWLGVRSWWRDPVRRGLMLCSLPIIAGHLLYHTTGETQPGYYRFALDYVPVWLAAGAGWLTTGWRRWGTGACIAWSVGYFGVLYA